MDSLQVSILLFGIILAVGVQSGHGIECYVCNSHYDGAKCEQADSLSSFKKDCNSLADAAQRNYTLCRKIEQTVEKESRVVRQCATQGREDRRCVERTGTQAVKVTYCECEGHFCNAAPVAFNLKIALLTVVSALAALIFHS